MGLLDGKIALVFGVANKDSIGWGIAKRLHQEGATILFSYAAAALEKRVEVVEERDAERNLRVARARRRGGYRQTDRLGQARDAQLSFPVLPRHQRQLPEERVVDHGPVAGEQRHVRHFAGPVGRSGST